MVESSTSWSAQYAVSNSRRTHSLPGDKILLPPSALEQLWNAFSRPPTEHTQLDRPTFDPYDSASFSVFNRVESQYQDQRQQLPYPLTFRLVNPENGRVVYAGVREFSADDGQLVLSPFLSEALQVSHASDDTVDGVSSHTITVHARELPKGTFVKLRPLEAGYNPEDWKALLEQHLRANYTTLTKGEVLGVTGGRGANGKPEEFKFLIDEIEPNSDGICIIDTDLEVDIEALNEEQARETLKRIAAKLTRQGNGQGSSPGGPIDLFKPQQGHVLPGEYVDYELGSWNRAQLLEIELDAEDGDEQLDLLVSPLSATQRAKPRLDEHVFADLEVHPTKRIKLEPTNAALENSEALLISVHAYGATSHADETAQASQQPPVLKRFTLRATHMDSSKDTIGNSSEEAPNDGDVRCKNCGKWVPGRTLMLHENFCLRNNVICPKGCGQVFQRGSHEFQQHWHCVHDSAYGHESLSNEKHNHYFHPSEVLRCAECGTKETFHNLSALAHHRTTTCPAKVVLCRFCHLLVPQEGDPDTPSAEVLLSGMTQHELLDGARTTECHLCRRITRLRDMDMHLKSHDLDRFSRPPPQPCRNVNCGRTIDITSKNGDTRAGTRMGQGPGNDIGLCSVCFGPLYVSMYDPENKALRRRVERRYLQQLITGCGKTWCSNEFCKVGRSHLELSTKTTTKDALPIVKPFVDSSVTPHSGSPLHFCVDEASQKRRLLAGMLTAEDGGATGKGGYGFEWCLGALEAESGDLDAGRQWLKNWAPARKEVRS